jgi:hypothetical protein
LLPAYCIARAAAQLAKLSGNVAGPGQEAL